MDKAAIVQEVERIVHPLVKHEGLSLVDISFDREHRGWVLRIYLDKDGGVTLDDCVQVSKELGQLLDVGDVIPTAYSLEVSSPGLDRPLKKAEDFGRYVGRAVRIRANDYIGGRRNFRGELLGCADGKVLVRVAGSEVFEIPLVSIRKANLEIEIGDSSRLRQ